ncbi:MAG: hypothetical protein K6G33_14080 [Ruminococcus sp.]|uniref:hypothetical protein n=1 Tax=Ruminococcus sp. TaxID=41978 RepID=UPI0025D515AA|nr:hypothetical protein [Ruminococcus sp.]MCR5601855.1 hypothetical protein [Ruminococcus sp.]
MIKGVNRKIIEIKNPDSLYFEKAILYLKPNITMFSEAASRKAAGSFLESIKSSEYAEKSRKRRRYLVFSALAVTVGALAIWLLR